MSYDCSEGESNDALEMFFEALADKVNKHRTDNGRVPVFKGVPIPNFCVFLKSVTSLNRLIELGFSCDTLDYKGNTPLHVASIMAFCGEVFQGLLSSQNALRTTSECCQTALHSAARANNLLAVQELLHAYHGMIDMKDDHGNTALHIAFYTGSLAVANFLIEQGADRDSTDDFGRTAAHCAALSASNKGICMLKNKGADLSVVDREGRTILHYAAVANRSLLRFLLDGALFDVDVQDKYGFTPLHYAAMTSSLKNVKSLCSYGASIIAAARNGLTPFHIASCLSEKCSILEFFASKLESEYMSIRMDGGLSPLHLAAEFDRISRVDLLLSESVSTELATENGETALHFAAFNGDQLIIKHLLDKNAYVNSCTNDGLTPLHLACFRPSLHVLQTLLERGADVNHLSGTNVTPLMLAASCDAERSFHAVSLLLESEADIDVDDNNKWTALHYALYARNLRTVELLIEKGANLKCTDVRGRNFLHLAVIVGDEQLIELFCNMKGDIFKSSDDEGFYPIHYAAINGSVNAVERLLKMGNLETFQGNLPHFLSFTHLAAIYNRPKVINALIKYEEKKGRRLTVQEQHWTGSGDIQRRIPLHYAMTFGHLECVKLLLLKPTYINWTDTKGATPLHLAASNGHMQCVDFALKAFPEHATDHNSKDNEKRTFGMLAIHHRSAGKSMLEGSDLSRVDVQGRGYLHRAVSARRIDLIHHLLRSIHPDVCDKNGVTPLHIAAHCGFVDMEKILVDHGGSITVKDNKGLTPGDWAAKNGQYNGTDFILDRATYGIEKESRPEVVTSASFMLACLRGYFDCVGLLYEFNPEFANSKDNRNRTPLHNAAEGGHYEIVEFLIKKGANIDAVDINKCTPMMIAAAKVANVKVIDLLMITGADATMADVRGNNVLHIACSNSNEEAVKVIVTHLGGHEYVGMLVEAVNEDDENIFHISVRNGLVECVQTLAPFISATALFNENRLNQLPLCAVLAASEKKQLACMMTLLPHYLNTLEANDTLTGALINRVFNGSRREDFSELEEEQNSSLGDVND